MACCCAGSAEGCSGLTHCMYVSGLQHVGKVVFVDCTCLSWSVPYWWQE